MNETNPTGYVYPDAGRTNAHTYLLPAVVKLLNELQWLPDRPKRVFDLGCGNGSVAAALSKVGYELSGIDSSEEGIKQANLVHSHLNLRQGSAYDDLAGLFGRYPALISLEVVEHVYYPRAYAKSIFELLEPGGTAIISTPYHGYLKNLVIAVTGKFDLHVNPLWDYGHIKFWSFKTLGKLLVEAGLELPRFVRVGRIPALAKSMIAITRRPET